MPWKERSAMLLRKEFVRFTSQEGINLRGLRRWLWDYARNRLQVVAAFSGRRSLRSGSAFPTSPVFAEGDVPPAALHALLRNGMVCMSDNRMPPAPQDVLNRKRPINSGKWTSRVTLSRPCDTFHFVMLSQAALPKIEEYSCLFPRKEPFMDGA
jgi:hypothetical protein